MLALIKRIVLDHISGIFRPSLEPWEKDKTPIIQKDKQKIVIYLQ